MYGVRAPALAIGLLSLGCGADAGDGDVGATAGSHDGEAPAVDAHAAVVDTCVADHPPAEPFDLGDTGDARATPAPQPGVEPPPLPPLTAADIAQVCRDSGGSGCDQQRFISRAAADCIARESEVAAGVAPWATSLEFLAPYDRVCWLILNKLEYTKDGFVAELLVLDATTGAELAHRSDRYQSPEY